MAGAFQHTGAFQSDYQYTSPDLHDPPRRRHRDVWPQTQIIRQSDLHRRLGILPGRRIPARDAPVEYEYVPEEAPSGPSAEQLAVDDRIIGEYLAQSYAERQTAINQALSILGDKILKDSQELLH